MQETLTGADGHVMVALGTYPQIAGEFSAIQDGAALFTFTPESLGHLVLVAAVRADPRGNEFFVPAHGLKVLGR